MTRMIPEIDVTKGENSLYKAATAWGYLPLHKDPVEQARSAMFHILHDYRSQNHQLIKSL